MQVTRKFVLAKQAKGKGGDKYIEDTSVLEAHEQPISGAVYVNQYFSRHPAGIVQEFFITIETVEI